MTLKTLGRCLVASFLFVGSIRSAVSQEQRFYHFQITVTGGTRPVVQGQTTAPDGTQMYVVFKRPWLPDGAVRLRQGLSACGDPCFDATGPHGQETTYIRVTKGSFSAGPFSFRGNPFWPATYTMQIFVVPNMNGPFGPLEKAEITMPAYSTRLRLDTNGMFRECEAGC